MLKRLFDISFTILFSPLILLILLFAVFMVFITDGRPIFFSQSRPGLNLKPFTIYKLKTMRDPTKDISSIHDLSRVTKMGRFLRKFSIDELPQFYNVLMGHMSIVGPRPLLFEYVKHHTKDELRRYSVRPGITGLAQTEGRNNLPWKKKFELDLFYVDKRSFFMDIRIILATFFVILSAKGINKNIKRTMDIYTGKDDN